MSDSYTSSRASSPGVNGEADDERSSTTSLPLPTINVIYSSDEFEPSTAVTPSSRYAPSPTPSDPASRLQEWEIKFGLLTDKLRKYQLEQLDEDAASNASGQFDDDDASVSDTYSDIKFSEWETVTAPTGAAHLPASAGKDNEGPQSHVIRRAVRMTAKEMYGGPVTVEQATLVRIDKSPSSPSS